MEEIQLHLGHEDLAFTQKTYVHLDERDGPNPELLDDLAGCEVSEQEPQPVEHAEPERLEEAS